MNAFNLIGNIRLKIISKESNITGITDVKKEIVSLNESEQKTPKINERIRITRATTLRNVYLFKSLFHYSITLDCDDVKIICVTTNSK